MKSTTHGSRPDAATTRERILAVAGQLFAAQGYHGTGVDQLCKAVGLGKGALYYHLDSKEQLLFELCRRNVADLIQEAVLLESRDLSAYDRLHAMSRSLMRNIADNQEEWQVFFHDFGALTGNRAQVVRRLRERFEELVAAMIEDCIREGTFRSTPALVVKGFLGLFNYSYVWYRPDGELTPEAIADIFFDVLVNGLDATTDHSMAAVGAVNEGART